MVTAEEVHVQMRKPSCYIGYLAVANAGLPHFLFLFNFIVNNAQSKHTQAKRHMRWTGYGDAYQIYTASFSRISNGNLLLTC